MMSALVVRAAFDRTIVPAFEAGGGGRVEIVWAPTSVLQDRLAAGEPTDAVLLTTEAVDALAAEGRLDPATRMDVVISRLGVAVRAGQPRPDLSSVDSFRQALLDARSVAFSRGGASGIYFAGLLDRLGIAAAVRAKATIIPAGFTAEQLMNGKADLAIQQISELMVVDGIEVAGPFPDAAQATMRFSAAAMVGAPPAAAAFLATLAGAPAAAAFTAGGLEPIR